MGFSDKAFFAAEKIMLSAALEAVAYV